MQDETEKDDEVDGRVVFGNVDCGLEQQSRQGDSAVSGLDMISDSPLAHSPVEKYGEERDDGEDDCTGPIWGELEAQRGKGCVHPII